MKIVILLFLALSLQANTIYGCVEVVTMKQNLIFKIVGKNITLMTKDKKMHDLFFRKRVNTREFSNDTHALGDIADIYENNTNQLVVFPHARLKNNSNVEIISANWINLQTGVISPHLCQINRGAN